MIKSKKGFTLIELIITITVLSIILMALGGVLVYSFNSFKRLNDRQLMHSEEQQLRMALLTMVRDARQSKNVTSSGANTLVLTVPRISNTDATVTYGINNNMLTRTVTNGPLDTDWNFVSARLASFNTDFSNGRSLDIGLVADFPNFAIDATVAINRIPSP